MISDESASVNSYSWSSCFDLNFVRVELFVDVSAAAVDDDDDVSFSKLVFTLRVTPFNTSDMSK